MTNTQAYWERSKVMKKMKCCEYSPRASGRELKIEVDRQKGRQADRKTGRQAGRQADRQTD